MTNNQSDPIAVVGIGCRVPDAHGPEALWDLLVRKHDAIREVSPDRWHPSRVVGEVSDGTSSYTKWAGLVKDIAEFDPAFFGISEREAEHMDPQQRLLLATAWEAIEDAGLVWDRTSPQAGGVFVGFSTWDYTTVQSNSQERLAASPFASTGQAGSILANRLSYCLDLSGPSIALDTACSSSLLAIHLAVQSIRNGESRWAIAGGVNAIFSYANFVAFSRMSAMAADGRCKPFSAAADGFVRSEGATLFVLMPLSAARAEGLPVYACIRESGTNQDGRTAGITKPSVDAQRDLILEVCRRAAVDTRSVAYVEAHGTGTAVGDPIEAAALGEVFARGRDVDQPLLIGSVKSNIGHLESAAGATGMAKAVLCLKNRQVPANLHFTEPNPAIDFTGLRLRVPTEMVPLRLPTPDATPYVGVNSFGFGGSNVFVLLGPAEDSAEERSDTTSGACIVPVTGASRQAVIDRAEQLAAWLADREVSLPDLAWTCVRHRRPLAYRATVRAASVDELIAGLHGVVAEPESRIDEATAGTSPVIVFSGQGPQWQGMGCELYASEPVFRHQIDACAAALARAGGWSLTDVLLAAPEESRMDETEFAQPCLVALQIGIFALLQSWGLWAGAVVGHSVGEISAAYAAGALDLDQAMRVIYHRGRTMSAIRSDGAMLAVGLSADDAREMLQAGREGIDVAAVNGPASVTLGGDRQALERLAETLDEQEIFNRFLRVSHAFHSAHMDPVQGPLLAALGDLQPSATICPMLSSVTGSVIDGGSLTADYWWRNVRETVRFADAIDTLAADGHRLFLEVSPHPVLRSSLRQCLANLEAGDSHRVVATLTRGEPEAGALTRTAMELYRVGVEVDLLGVTGVASGSCLRLPSYPWQQVRLWQESPLSAYFRTQAATPRGMLDLVAPMPTPAWNATLSSGRFPFLQDHVIGRSIIVPGAIMLELALEAGATAGMGLPLRLRDVKFRRQIQLPSGDRLLNLVVTTHPDTGRFAVQSHMDRASSDFQLHADGILRPATGVDVDIADSMDLEAIRRVCHKRMSARVFYDAFSRFGYRYGPSFRGLHGDMYLGDAQAVCRLELPEHVSRGDYLIHPVMLDAAFHLTAPLATGDDNRARIYLPDRVEDLILYREAPRSGWAYCRLREGTIYRTVSDIWICDDSGRLCVQIVGLVTISQPHSVSELATNSLLYDMAWRPKALPGASAAASLFPPPQVIVETLEPTYAHLQARLPESPDHDPGVLEWVTQAARRLGPGGAVSSGLPDWLRDRVDAAQGAIPASWDADAEWRALLRRLPHAYAELAIARAAIEAGPDDDSETAALCELRADREANVASLQLVHLAIRELAHQLTSEARGRLLRVLIVGDEFAGRTSHVLSGLPAEARVHVALETEAARARAVDQFTLDARVRVVDWDWRSTVWSRDHDLVIAINAQLPDGDVDAAVSRLVQELTPGGLLLAGDVGTRCLDLLAMLPSSGLAATHYNSHECWSQALRQVGEIVDLLPPQAGRSVLLCRLPVDAEPQLEPPAGKWLIVGEGPLAEQIAALWEPALRPGIIAADGLDEAIVHAADQPLHVVLAIDPPTADPVEAVQLLAPSILRTVNRLNDLADTHTIASLVLVTCAAWVVPGDPESSLVSGAFGGLMRVVMTEMQRLRARHLDLPATADAHTLAAARAELWYHDASEELVALRASGRYIMRLAPLVPTTLSADVRPQPASSHCALRMEARGSVDRLTLAPVEVPVPGEGEVVIRIQALALNFRDLLKVLGMYPGETHESSALGDEGAGLVLAVGPGVTDFAPGDAVVFGSAGDAAATVITIRQDQVARMPDGLTPEDAASMVAVCSTAWYGLSTVGRLRAGERVLIHAGAGGVGMAAIMIARHLGAEIYATAGTPFRRKLLRWLGVEHVYNSRTLDFADEILRDTAGEGVDVVLNSLAGAALRRSLELLRSGGRFVELGKRDLYAGGEISLLPFRHCISFTSIDLSLGLMAPGDLHALIDQGAIAALPYHRFVLPDATDAFRMMMAARQVGKIVLSTDLARVQRQPVPVRRLLPVHADATYLVTGGLRGLGLALADWLAYRGARQLILCSRTGAIHEDSEETFRQFAEYGITVRTAAVDIGDRAQVAALLAAHRDLPPIRGIIHAAAFWQDCLLSAMDGEVFDTVFHPKAAGAWHLHELTKDQPLDFFVMLSSMASPTGNPGQGHYVAANAFMESLARQRHLAGLPGLAVCLDRVTDVGYVARRDDLSAYMDRQGWTGISPDTVCAAIEHLSVNRVPVGLVSSARWRDWQTHQPALLSRPRYEEVLAGDTKDASAGTDVLAELSGLTGTKLEIAVRAYLRRRIATILRISESRIRPDQSLQALGLDSLLAVELFTMLDGDLGGALSVGQIQGEPSLNSLTTIICRGLARDSGGADTSPETTPTLDSLVAADLKLLDDLPAAIEGTAAADTVPRYVLLTGATGNVGAYVLDQLLRQTEARIACLVRGDLQSAMSRLRAGAIDPSLFDAQAHRLELLLGDVEKARLGLTDSTWTRLSEELDAIYHVAARVSHLANYADLRVANVRGTEQVIRLASGRGCAIHYVSSIAVIANDRLTSGVLETEPPSAWQYPTYGYGATKAVAEHLLGEAQRRGLPVAIYRVGWLLDDKRCLADASDIVWTYIREAANGRVPVSPVIHDSLGLTPISYLAQGLVWLSLQQRNGQSTYHLISPQAVRLDEIRELVCEMDSDAPVAAATDPVDQESPLFSSLLKTFDHELVSLVDQVGSGTASFSIEATSRALAGSGITGTVDPEAVRSTVDYLYSEGGWAKAGRT